MAKISPILGGLSGSIAGSTFAHNRGGQYVRQRTIPVNPAAIKQAAVRNIVAIASGAWFSLTSTQRTQWNNWASLNPVVDSLGQAVQLTGHQAYVGLSTRLGLAGVTAVATPPITTGPPDLLTASVVPTAPGSVAVTYTPTPLAAGLRLVVWGTLPAPISRNPNRNQARLLGISAAAAASPQTIASPYPAIATQYSNFWCCVMDAAGQVSPGLMVRAEWI